MSKSQVILITGATAGIGRHAALHLARRGHHVIATGRREPQLATLRAEAAQDKLHLDTLVLDVTREASIADAARAVDGWTTGRGLDALVNNAGFGQFGPLEALSDADLRKQFETNVFGLLAVTRAFLPAMRARRAGRIVNVSSVGGRVVMPLGGAYHATKFAVEALSDTLRRELLGFGVGVAVIEPGPIASEFGVRASEAADRYRDPLSPYAHLLARGDQMMALSHRFVAPPLVISKAITEAIEARHPRARYVAPISSRIMLASLNLLPTPVADWFIARVVFGSRAKSANAQHAG